MATPIIWEELRNHDWEEFRNQFAELREWVRKWDRLFVLNQPSSQAECYAAVEEHRQEIDWLREGIERASGKCGEYLKAHTKSKDAFVQFERPKTNHLSPEIERKFLAVRAGFLAVAASERLTDRSFVAETNPSIDWECLHVPRDTTDTLQECKRAINSACWILLQDVEGRGERLRLAARMSAKLKPALGKVRELDESTESHNLPLWKVTLWLKKFGSAGSELTWGEVHERLQLFCRHLFPEKERTSPTYPQKRTMQIGVKAAEKSGWEPIECEPPAEMPDELLDERARQRASN